MLKLVIGNKNYSSWSMRPWVLLEGDLVLWDTLAEQNFLDFQETYRLQR